MVSLKRPLYRACRAPHPVLAFTTSWPPHHSIVFEKGALERLLQRASKVAMAPCPSRNSAQVPSTAQLLSADLKTSVGPACLSGPRQRRQQCGHVPGSNLSSQQPRQLDAENYMYMYHTSTAAANAVPAIKSDQWSPARFL